MNINDLITMKVKTYVSNYDEMLRMIGLWGHRG